MKQISPKKSQLLSYPINQTKTMKQPKNRNFPNSSIGIILIVFLQTIEPFSLSYTEKIETINGEQVTTRELIVNSCNSQRETDDLTSNVTLEDRQSQ